MRYGVSVYEESLELGFGSDATNIATWCVCICIVCMYYTYTNTININNTITPPHTYIYVTSYVTSTSSTID